MNTTQVKTQAANAVLAALLDMYKDADAESMTDFAEAIAEAAVIAVQHVIDNAEIDISGTGLN